MSLTIRSRNAIRRDGTYQAPNAKYQRSLRVRTRATTLAQSGVGLALLLAYDRDVDLVRVVESVGLVTPFYLLMHRDMQRTPKVRAFADFVASEIKTLREPGRWTGSRRRVSTRSSRGRSMQQAPSSQRRTIHS